MCSFFVSGTRTTIYFDNIQLGVHYVSDHPGAQSLGSNPLGARLATCSLLGWPVADGSRRSLSTSLDSVKASQDDVIERDGSWPTMRGT